MRDFRDAKTMAHTLRNALRIKAIEISHSDSLELIAKAFGFDNWNILSAKIAAGSFTERPALELRKDTHCSFCGKSQHEVRKLVAGPAASICDGCIRLCLTRLKNPIKDGIDAVSRKTANDNS